jgi:hypothetical protein
MDLVKRVFKRSLLLLIPIALLSALIEWKKLPASILVGGGLALLNIKGLAWGVEGLLGTHKATIKMVFFSQFRLFMLFLILAVLIYLKLVNVFGILIGFTVVFALLMIEGYRLSRKDGKAEGK